ncbi:hypothetical protein [uncultured Serinicoccus sp.]|uniref:iron-sulfur cluster-binding protein n=1 Tax=uncultured Serinicoccus sp. TaxID=735514 RepID=UPI002616B644|nr:hypothetical protein [uncultured Serinicoccus sp.]
MTGDGPAGPVRTGVVTLARPAGAFDVLSLAVPAGPDWATARPGQFLVVPGNPGRGDALPGLHWLADVSVDPVHGTAVEVAVRAGGGWDVGHRLRLIGPLGRGFGVPTDPVPALVVGHGGSTVPLRWLVARLRARGCPVHVVLSADDPDEHFEVASLRRLAASVRLTAEPDLGRVATQVLEQEPRTGVVYAAGPRATVAQVARAAVAAGRPVRVSALDLAEPVLCGTGLCGQCDLEVSGSAGGRSLRPCLEGPVVPGEQVLDAPR